MLRAPAPAATALLPEAAALLDEIDQAADRLAELLDLPRSACAYISGTADDLAGLWSLTRRIRLDLHR